MMYGVTVYLLCKNDTRFVVKHSKNPKPVSVFLFFYPIVKYGLNRYCYFECHVYKLNQNGKGRAVLGEILVGDSNTINLSWFKNE
jgi:hypothetical protein